MKKTTIVSKNAQNVTTLKTEAVDKVAEREALDKAIALIASKAKGSLEMSVNEAGKLLASLDTIFIDIATQVAAVDPKAPVWALDLIPISVTLSDGKHQWVEVKGLDRNARVQISDAGNGACLVHVSALKSRSAEATAYFETLVGSSKDLTAAITTRKAVAGHTFRQVFAIATKLEQDRIQKKYADMCPPKSEATATLIKKTDVA